MVFPSRSFMTRSRVRLIFPFSSSVWLFTHPLCFATVGLRSRLRDGKSPLHSSVLRKPANAQWQKHNTGFFVQTQRSGLRAPTYPREYRSLALLCVGGQATETAGVGRIQSQTRRVPTLPARLDDASRGRQLPTQVRHAEGCRRSGQAGTRQFCVSFGCHSVKWV
jgi:hypothetical protein